MANQEEADEVRPGIKRGTGGYTQKRRKGWIKKERNPSYKESFS